MPGLDFKRATDLFMGTERELALALGVERSEIQRYRKDPAQVPRDLLDRLGRALGERGRGMIRVGEMLEEDARD